MPRQPRIALGDIVYHVLNRGNGRRTIFSALFPLISLILITHKSFSLRKKG